MGERSTFTSPIREATIKQDKKAAAHEAAGAVYMGEGKLPRRPWMGVGEHPDGGRHRDSAEAPWAPIPIRHTAGGGECAAVQL